MRDDVSRKSKEWVRGEWRKVTCFDARRWFWQWFRFWSDDAFKHKSLSLSHLYLLFLSLKYFTFYSHSSRASNWLMIIISHSTHQNRKISIFFNSLTFEAKFKPLENQREWTSKMSKFEGEKKRMESGGERLNGWNGKKLRVVELSRKFGAGIQEWLTDWLWRYLVLVATAVPFGERKRGLKNEWESKERKERERKIEEWMKVKRQTKRGVFYLSEGSDSFIGSFVLLTSTSFPYFSPFHLSPLSLRAHLSLPSSRSPSFAWFSLFCFLHKLIVTCCCLPLSFFFSFSLFSFPFPLNFLPSADKG